MIMILDVSYYWFALVCETFKIKARLSVDKINPTALGMNGFVVI